MFSRSLQQTPTSLTSTQNVLERNVAHLSTLTPDQQELIQLRAENALLKEQASKNTGTIETAIEVLRNLIVNMGFDVSSLVASGRITSEQLKEIQRILPLIESKQKLTAAELYRLNEDIQKVLSNSKLIQGDVGVMRGDIGFMRGDIGVIKEDVGLMRGDVTDMRSKLSSNTETLENLDRTMRRLEENTKGLVGMVQYLMDLSLKTNALITKIDEIHGKKLDAVQAEIVRVRNFLEVSCVVSGKNLTQIIYEIVQCIYQFIRFCFVLLKYVSILVLEMQAFFASSLSDKLPERYRARAEVVIFTLLSGVQLYFLSILGNMFGSIFGFEKIGTAAMTMLIRTISNCISYLKELFVSFVTDPRISSSVKALATLFYIKLGIIYEFVYTTGRNYLVSRPDITEVMGGGPDELTSEDTVTSYEPSQLLLGVTDSIQGVLFDLLDMLNAMNPEGIDPDSLSSMPMLSKLSTLSPFELKQLGFQMDEFKSIVQGKRSGGVRLRTKKNKNIRKKKKKVRKTRK